MTPKPSRIVRKGETVTAKGPDANWYMDMWGLNGYNTRGIPHGVIHENPPSRRTNSDGTERYQKVRPSKARHFRTREAHKRWWGPNKTW